MGATITPTSGTDKEAVQVTETIPGLAQGVLEPLGFRQVRGQKRLGGSRRRRGGRLQLRFEGCQVLDQMEIRRGQGPGRPFLHLPPGEGKSRGFRFPG